MVHSCENNLRERGEGFCQQYQIGPIGAPMSQFAPLASTSLAACLFTFHLSFGPGHTRLHFGGRSMKHPDTVVSQHIDQIRLFYFADLFTVFYAIPTVLVSLVGSIPHGPSWLSNHGRCFLLLYLTCALVLTISITLYYLVLTWMLSNSMHHGPHLSLPSGFRRSGLVLLKLDSQ